MLSIAAMIMLDYVIFFYSRLYQLRKEKLSYGVGVIYA